MQAHLRGRKHQLILDRTAEASRSVYVRGLSEDLEQEKDLLDVLGQFGEIKNSWIDLPKVSSSNCGHSEVFEQRFVCRRRMP